MATPLETLTFKDAVVNIFYDNDPIDPLKYQDCVTLLCSHPRYNLGTEQIIGDLDDHIAYIACGMSEDFDELFSDEELSQEELYKIAWSIFESNVYGLTNLYLYDHSGITMHTQPFSCPWDSGKVGIAYMTKKQAKAAFGDNPTEEQAKDYIESVVKEYDHYISGECYGYSSKEEDGDSCWGILGYDNLKEILHDRFGDEITV